MVGVRFVTLTELAGKAISTRRPKDGEKRCVPGSKRGLIIPKAIDQSQTIYVVEGASDVAAAVSIGLQAVGRPSAMGGLEHLTELLESWEGEVVVLGENDRKANGEWPGRTGAIRMAASLSRRLASPIRWSMPPADRKDIRAWVQAERPDLKNPEGCRALGLRIRDAIFSNATYVADDPTARRNMDGAQEEKPRKSQADLLVELVNENKVELFHTPGGAGTDAFATIDFGSHRETWPVASNGFRFWLGKIYFERHHKAPNNEAIKSALNTLHGQALYLGFEFEVALRIAGRGEEVFVDLCDDRWRVVRITKSGWAVIAGRDCPVRFVRKKGMLAMPEPKSGGSINQFRSLLNVPSDDDWLLVVAFILVCFHPRGPYLILCVNGEHGSAKSTLCRLIRNLVDPNLVPLRRPPREERDVMISARNSWFIAYTNLSYIPEWLSDALCSIVYREGGGTRQLYSNDEETLFNAARPSIVNGIEGLMIRSDFADRCIHVVLPQIMDRKRLTDEEIDEEFERIRPGVLGAVFDAISCALRNAKATKIDRLPRMATAAKWVVASESALPWREGSFLKSFRQNRAEINQDLLAASPVGSAILDFMEGRLKWEGTASMLLTSLASLTDYNTRKQVDWPKAPNSLSGKLNRLAPNLRGAGIEIVFARTSDRRREKKITLERTKLPSDDVRPGSDDLSSVDRPAEDAIERDENAISDDPDGSDGLLPSFSKAGTPHMPTNEQLSIPEPREEGEI